MTRYLNLFVHGCRTLFQIRLCFRFAHDTICKRQYSYLYPNSHRSSQLLDNLKIIMTVSKTCHGLVGNDRQCLPLSTEMYWDRFRHPTPCLRGAFCTFLLCRCILFDHVSSLTGLQYFIMNLFWKSRRFQKATLLLTSTHQTMKSARLQDFQPIIYGIPNVNMA